MAILTAKCANCDTSVITPGELVKCEECGDLVCESCIVRSEDDEKNKTVLCEHCDVAVYEGEDTETSDDDDDDEELDDEDDEDLDDEDEDSDDDEELEIGVDDDDDEN